jgi:hypothetical protein
VHPNQFRHQLFVSDAKALQLSGCHAWRG